MRLRPYAPALNAFGLIIMIFGLLMLFPLGVSLWLSDGAERAYEQAIGVTILAGLLIWLFTHRYKRNLRVHDGFLLVVATWTILPFFGAIPLYNFHQELSVTHAYFEAASALTATGATVLTGLDVMPYSINLWRTFMHWIGGMGIIVLVVAILPLLGIGGRQLFKVETPTPMKESGLTPRIAETAKGLWVTYCLLTVLCGMCLWMAGMPHADALLHAFSVMGLGGFSNHDASLAHYDSLGIELVVMIFAVLSALNFATHYLALTRRSFQPYRNDPEIPMFFKVLGISILLLTLYLLLAGSFTELGTALRRVSFHVVSVSTTLGMVSCDYALWPLFAQLWMLMLGSFVACSGSTGGGLKMMRALILSKQVSREIVHALHPNAVKPVVLNGRPISEKMLHAVLGFSFMYMVSVASLTLALTLTDMDLTTAFSAVMACLNNIGPGMGAVGPDHNYQALTSLQTWLLSFTMILGRLEIFTLLVVLTPAFWRR